MSWSMFKNTPFGVHFTMQFSLQSKYLPNRLDGVSAAIKNACCADKGPTYTHNCSDSGIAMATPDTPTTLTCSRDTGALGRSLRLIADFVAPVSTRKGICCPSIVKVSFCSSHGLEVNKGNADDASPRPDYFHCGNGLGGGMYGANGGIATAPADAG